MTVARHLETPVAAALAKKMVFVGGRDRWGRRRSRLPCSARTPTNGTPRI
jgi:hypothetical protein